MISSTYTTRPIIKNLFIYNWLDEPVQYANRLNKYLIFLAMTGRSVTCQQAKNAQLEGG